MKHTGIQVFWWRLSYECWLNVKNHIFMGDFKRPSIESFINILHIYANNPSVND